MVKLGWLAKTQKIEEKLKNLYGFFGIASLLNLSKIGVGEIAFRKKESRGFSPLTLALWLRKGELECLSLEISDFDKKKLANSLGKLKSLTLRPFDEIKLELKAVLLECGVILCYTPKLKNSCVSGASRWHGNNILIQISDAGKKEDIFWFTLFHELGHTLKHLYNSKKANFIDLEDEHKNELEIEADNFATETLVPSSEYNNWKTSSDLSFENITSFAYSIGVDPGIVAGRLNHDKLIDFSQTSKLKRQLSF